MSNKENIFKEHHNFFIVSISSFFIYFMSSFGISDFVLSTVIYNKLNYLKSKKLIATMNISCVIPCFMMAILSINSIYVDPTTILVAILSQVTGAYLTPKLISKLNKKIINIFIIIGLFTAAIIILIGKLNFFPIAGNETKLFGNKLILFGILSFFYGALNNIGVGSFSFTMATVYAMGLNSRTAFPIMMGSCALSLPVASFEFIKLNNYSRKISLISSIFGSCAVFIAIKIVKTIDTSIIQWIIFLIIIYSVFDMIFRRNKI
ncbi:MAG: hypothetical protein LBJ93_00425 [Clostridiales bacterium]|nr:hypothetical protein [Clostridiales bacterium]